MEPNGRDLPLPTHPAALTAKNVQVRNVELWLQFTLVSSASCRGPILCHEAAFLGGWTSPVRQDTSDERMSSWERSTDRRHKGLVEGSSRSPGRGGPERRRRPRPDGTGTPMLTRRTTTSGEERVQDDGTALSPLEREGLAEARRVLATNPAWAI